MGADNPRSLLNAIWWRNNFFGLRGRDEHHKLRWGDLSIEEEVDGTQYIKYQERDTKTRKDPREERAFAPKLYATPNTPDTCPVNLLLKYTHKRPLTMCQPDSPFYIQPKQAEHLQKDTTIWYKAQPLGIHSLSGIMKNMAEIAEIPGRKTNHSGRKTTVKRLREAAIDAVDIVQLTGHKNVQTINNYSDVSAKKQRQMSNILTTGIDPSSADSTLGSNFSSANCEMSVAKTSKSATITANQTNASADVCPDKMAFDDGLDDIFAAIKEVDGQNECSTANTCNSLSQQTLGLISPLFASANISGGSFNITMNFNK